MRSSKVDLLSAIDKDPLFLIKIRNERYLSHASVSGLSQIYMASFDNVLDAINSRDLFIKEWYGVSLYKEILNLNSHAESREIKKFGNIYYNQSGGLLDKRLRPLIFSKKRIVFDDGIELSLSSESCMSMICGSVFKRTDGLFFRFTDGVVLQVIDYTGPFVSNKDVTTGRWTKDHKRRYNKLCSKTGKYVSTAQIDGKKFYLGTFESPEIAESVAFEYILKETGEYSIFDPRYPIAINDTDDSYGVKLCSRRYNSRISVNGREFFVGVFIRKSDAVGASLDAYYLFHGYFHKTDKRRIK
jgi:hypothetical protein